MKTLEIKKEGLKALAKELGATFKGNKSFEDNLPAVRTKFSALADDASKHALLQSVFPEGYDDSVSPDDYFDGLTELVEIPEPSTEGNGADQSSRSIVAGDGFIEFTRNGQLIQRQVMAKANNPDLVDVIVTLTALYKTARPSGNQNWTPTENAPVDVLGGELNKVVMLEGVDERGATIKVATNLRFINSVKGKRLFGAAFHKDGKGRNMPSSVVDNDGEFIEESELQFTLVGRRPSAQKGHTYAETAVEAVTAAKKAGYPVTTVTNNGNTQEAVFLKYILEGEFLFSTFGNKAGKIVSKIYSSRLATTMKQEEHIALTVDVKHISELKDLAHTEQNFELLKSGQAKRTQLQMAKYLQLTEAGMAPEMASTIAFA